MRVADIWEKLYPLVVRLIKDMMTGGPGGPYLPLAGGTMTGQIVLDGFARVEKHVTLFGLYAPLAQLVISFGSTIYLEVPTDWDTSTDLKLKFRWGCLEDYAVNSGEVNLGFVLSVAAVGETFAVEATDFPGDTNIPATAGTVAETEWTLDNTLIAPADILGLVVLRTTLDDGNDPTAPVYYVSAELKYTANYLGEPV
jgi:hypothetical protein